MIAVITGDVINSKTGNVKEWLPLLKDILSSYGNTPKHWEVYRGDSFQLVLDPKKALLAAIHIKSVLKQIKTYDVRMAIGIGKETYSAHKITESNGSAYVNSGECFENLRKDSLALKTTHSNIDIPVNIMIKLALLTIDNWSPVVSKVIKTAIEYPKAPQKDLAKHLNRSQSNISEALKRGGYEEIAVMNQFYVTLISKL
jgi:hypothetical protein